MRFMLVTCFVNSSEINWQQCVRRQIIYFVYDCNIFNIFLYTFFFFYFVFKLASDLDRITVELDEARNELLCLVNTHRTGIWGILLSSLIMVSTVKPHYLRSVTQTSVQFFPSVEIWKLKASKTTTLLTCRAYLSILKLEHFYVHSVAIFSCWINISSGDALLVFSIFSFQYFQQYWCSFQI